MPLFVIVTQRCRLIAALIGFAVSVAAFGGFHDIPRARADICDVVHEPAARSVQDGYVYYTMKVVNRCNYKARVYTIGGEGTKTPFYLDPYATVAIRCKEYSSSIDCSKLTVVEAEHYGAPQSQQRNDGPGGVDLSVTPTRSPKKLRSLSAEVLRIN